jgi:uncharacterized protein YdeI (YjbR/CyaY-like superfamily)
MRFSTTMGGAFMLPLAAEHRAAAGLAALATDVPVRSSFDALSYSKRRAFVLSVEGAKSDATRQRRIVKAVQNLGEGKARP